ncbi:PIF-2 [Urbanus proteus nucleopolyhedrovirus]|uniref:PIF-2 n=1 Tax=Urbanus proteus nucleopolyhedrovirus TaxID=1675866 RepID=A0A161C6X0_9ABAC|nr:PIF-2 [Urbanus proteus nucleopolyhedrovirus]AKR17325.1 PIF-2 [Urbanus proteus nucleopolyhedrovirus]
MFYFLITIIVVIFIVIILKPLHDGYRYIKTAQKYYNDTLDYRIDYIENVLKRRKYVPLSSLPRINFETDLGTINDGETKCLSMPKFVGTEFTPNFNCELICNDPSAAYFFVGEHDKFVVNGQLLMSGGYCTLNSVPRDCNRETSVVLHSLNQWTCIAEDPRYYAGTSNMIQVAGRQHAQRIKPGDSNKNVLFDRLLGMEVNVSRNTFRESWDELMADGSRRFEMRCNALDDHNNRMFLNPYNPIECLPNVCTKVNFVHPSVRPDFKTGECECGDFEITRLLHIVPNDKTSICASVIDRFNRTTLSHEFRTDCLSLESSMSEYAPNKLLCPPSIFTANSDHAYVFTLPGTFPITQDGVNEPTHRLYMETRDRIYYNHERAVPH